MALAVGVALGAGDQARAAGQVLTFDDLPDPFLSDIFGVASVPNGYGGFQWDGFTYFKASSFVGNPSGAPNGLVSGEYVASSGGAGASSLTLTGGGPFNFNSVYLTSVWNDNLSITVSGYLGAAQLYTDTVSVSTTGSTLFNFDFAGIDSLTFTSSGGTQHEGYANSTGNFVLDNLATGLDIAGPGDEDGEGELPDPQDPRVVPVPEPSSLISAAAAVAAGLGLGARRRRRAV